MSGTIKPKFNYDEKIVQLLEEKKHPKKLSGNDIFREFDLVQLKTDWFGKMTKGQRGIVLEKSGRYYLTVEFPDICECSAIPASHLKLQVPKKRKAMS